MSYIYCICSGKKKKNLLCYVPISYSQIKHKQGNEAHNDVSFERKSKNISDGLTEALLFSYK